MVTGVRTSAGSVLIFSKGGDCKEKREDGNVYEVPFVQTTKMTAGGKRELHRSCFTK